ncbi:hypothetical protein [Halochromatium roseum]|uniref:hypothetical protein n=1 Tax=Halochromatium roseum TaxID=391920 RepID=UPI001911704A|nr:hypothetical protein [Halochromatium roseum]
MLGDRGSVRISKNLYAPTGEAQLIFPDMPLDGDSAYGQWEPFQPITISMRRWREGSASLEDFYVVFRGFLRSVGRNESIDGQGKPQRFVTVVAHDAGCLFLVERLHPWITFQNRGIPTKDGASTFLNEYLVGTELVSKAHPAGDFLWEVATITTDSMMTAAGYEFQKKFFVKRGTIIPATALSQEGPVWSLLDRYADRPWNEFFVREGEDNPELVFRPAPWFDMDGNPLPDFDDDVNADLRFFEIPMSNVVALNAHRDDAEMVNHVWVVPPQGAAIGYASSVANGMGVVNAETRAKYGDRIQIEETHLLPSQLSVMNNREAEQNEAQEGVKGWAEERQKWLIQAGEQTHNFERGSLTVKGYASYRVGDYFRLKRSAKSESLWWSAYVTQVVHDFQPFNRFLCTLHYIRSDQWVRRKNVQGAYWVERQRGIDVA